MHAHGRDPAAHSYSMWRNVFYMGLISWRVWFVFPVECLRQTGCNSKHQTALFQAGSTDSRGRAAAMVSRGSATMYC